MNYSFPNPQFNLAGLQAICAAYPVKGVEFVATNLGDTIIVTKIQHGRTVRVDSFTSWAALEAEYNLIMVEGDYCGEVDAYLLAVENTAFIERLHNFVETS